ncbi:MAG: Mut7-C ubiquitin/RNAse domain-containing protein [Calditrichaceae bacterium]|nr:Mut7-C ubiquitin/RNAse domain-containing protein [Calditrichaceae bacterium]MBN2710192.1 Mut7-C ubiquitin/RNAse domain-containing protein [Calditrichaceae bacterium]RQV94166.1 MAG: twitching motility protein PilT [Calditrichota bacterium]
MNQDTHKKAWFRFYAELNDFLPAAKKQISFAYEFSLAPSVKDAIEAIGVPHPEVDLILVNGNSVDFSYRLKDNDRISVYPEYELYDVSGITRLRPKPLRRPKFILDVNLGRLAKKLRMLGFDVLYKNNFSDDQIIETAFMEKRIILTRDQGLLKTGKVDRGYWVRHTNIHEQLPEIIRKFDLLNLIRPFSRCMDCNGLIVKTSKAKIRGQLKPRTEASFSHFYRCKNCGKIYWQGAHYEKMIKYIEQLKLEIKDE